MNSALKPVMDTFLHTHAHTHYNCFLSNNNQVLFIFDYPKIR